MDMLQGPLTRFAFCWRVQARDGSGLALTSHDEMLTISGRNYVPDGSMTPQAVVSELDGESDQGEIAGAITSAALGRASLLAGRWDSADIELFIVDWDDPDEERLTLFAGELGEIIESGDRFEAGLLSAMRALDAPACPETSPLCRAELGDRHCRVDLNGRSIRATVTGHDRNMVQVDVALDESFRFGRLRFLDGSNRNVSATILDVTDQQITLRETPCFPVANGLRVEIRAGCDKTLATCSSRYANSANFRGEPHLPGADLLTRYPGA